MHFYFFVRGINQQVELWKILMQAQFFKWRKTNLKTGKKEKHVIQGALRPSIFGAWEYVFPEEALADVLSMMALNKNSLGVEKNLLNKSRLAMLRKIFGAKKISKKVWEQVEKINPKILLDGSERALYLTNTPGVSVHPIGIKKDRREKSKIFGYDQEML